MSEVVSAEAAIHRFPASGASVTERKRLWPPALYHESFGRCVSFSMTALRNSRFCGRMAGHAPHPSPHRFRRAPPQPRRGEAPCAPFAHLRGGEGECLRSRPRAGGPGVRRGRGSCVDRAGGGARAAARGRAAPDAAPAGIFLAGGARTHRGARSYHRGARPGAARHAREGAAAEEDRGGREAEHRHEPARIPGGGSSRRARSPSQLLKRRCGRSHDAFCRRRRQARRQVAARALRGGDHGRRSSAKPRQFRRAPALSGVAQGLSTAARRFPTKAPRRSA